MGEIVKFPPREAPDAMTVGAPSEEKALPKVASGNGPVVEQSKGFAVSYSNIPVVISLDKGGVVPTGQVYRTFDTAEEANEFSDLVLKIIGFIVLSSHARPREGKDAEFIDGGRMQALLVEHMLKMGNQ